MRTNVPFLYKSPQRPLDPWIGIPPLAERLAVPLLLLNLYGIINLVYLTIKEAPGYLCAHIPVY